MKRLLALSLLALAACTPPPPEGNDARDDEDPVPTYEPIDGSFVVGTEDRPVTVFVPDSYNPDEALPFLLLLHGYGFSGAQMDSLLRFNAFANTNRFIYARPEGLTNSDGDQFWNATEVCCDFEGTDVDDSAFLRDVVEQAMAKAHVDPARVFVVGHSNGGFMAQRLACDHADLFSAIVSLAGATTLQTCAPSEGIAVLEVHGTADETIAYEGGSFAPGFSYPGAEETASLWASRNACDEASVPGGVLDLETYTGSETSIERWENCKPGGAAELWTVNGGTHVPRGGADYLDLILAFLLEHAR